MLHTCHVSEVELNIYKTEQNHVSMQLTSVKLHIIVLLQMYQESVKIYNSQVIGIIHY